MYGTLCIGMNKTDKIYEEYVLAIMKGESVTIVFELNTADEDELLTASGENIEAVRHIAAS